LAAGVAGVAVALRLEDLLEVFAGLLGPAAGPLLVGGGEEDLQRRLGADDGADVPPLGDVAAARDQLPLPSDHRRPHPRLNGDHRGCGADVVGADRLADVALAQADPWAV